MAEHESNKVPRLSVMVNKGDLDWACPAFITASAAAALGWSVTISFTIHGTSLLKKEVNPDNTPVVYELDSYRGGGLPGLRGCYELLRIATIC